MFPRGEESLYGFVPEGVGRMANVRDGMVEGVCEEAEGSG